MSAMFCTSHNMFDIHLYYSLHQSFIPLYCLVVSILFCRYITVCFSILHWWTLDLLINFWPHFHINWQMFLFFLKYRNYWVIYCKYVCYYKRRQSILQSSCIILHSCQMIVQKSSLCQIFTNGWLCQFFSFHNNW